MTLCLLAGIGTAAAHTGLERMAPLQVEAAEEPAGADPAADAAETPENGSDTDSSGGYFITKKHIIISIAVSLGLAILIAVLEGRKKFKNEL